MQIADLHIHSRYSRATSRDCVPEQLALWAAHKGIDLLGTGDFTHPAWREELKEKLTPAEEGLYVLKEEYRRKEEGTGGAALPRFVVSGEISSIYKKNGKTRKVHSLILLPGLWEAELLARKLEAIGNIHSDGRPILGLDCHDLLEITLEVCPRAVYIPAHIWTPHFSLFGASSGFDTIEDCYGDLTQQIHALETGLSSDPPMNWRWTALDRFQLISNSDAHSPGKLGREANLLDVPLSYTGLSDAIQRGEGLAGTIEFFPEEGKYHYDGHRKCHLCLSPMEAEAVDGRCPVCGRKLTFGVSHRIEQLADRPVGAVRPGAKSFERLVPLPEVIAASIGCASSAVRVHRRYEEMLRKLGPEFRILRELPPEDIRKAAGDLVAEGIRRLREGRVEWNPGYDGEYGTIRLFEPEEIQNLDGQCCFFGIGRTFGTETRPAARKAAIPAEPRTGPLPLASAGNIVVLNAAQQEAVVTAARAIAVIAGPGTGKTGTLVSRAAYLLTERKVKASEITAVTFTQKAAEELETRLAERAGGRRTIGRMTVGTFHSICYRLLRAQGLPFRLADAGEQFVIAREALIQTGLAVSPRRLLQRVSLKKAGLTPESGVSAGVEAERIEAACEAYQELLAEAGLWDYDDLLTETLRLLEREKKDEIRKKRFSYLLVDEFQDISPMQYALIQAWNKNGRELFVIGDPDQAIYSFRGADAGCFEKLLVDWPALHTIRLVQNYRSAAPILSAALAVIGKNEGPARVLLPVRKAEGRVRLVTATGELAEGIFAAKEISRLVGGIDMLDADRPLFARAEEQARGFGDIALLYRTHSQEELLEKCLRKEGIPYVVAGRADFLSEDPVRGAILFFRHLADPEDTAAVRLCCKLLWDLQDNPISVARLAALSEKYLPKWNRERPQKLLLDWMEDMGLANGEPMEKLLGTALFYQTMPELLDALAFGSEGDLRRCGGKPYTSDSVTLMTLHGAKGLEFPVVLLCGVKKGRIPMEHPQGESDLAEERRLLYVGMTRAEEELILVTSPEPSPFLTDLPEAGVLRESVGRQMHWDCGIQMSFSDYM